MLNKFFQNVFMVIGGIAGYGVSRMVVSFLDQMENDFYASMSLAQKLVFTLLFIFIFVTIFYSVVPAINKQSHKFTTSIESELAHANAGEIVVGTAGLITGFLLAYLMSKVYELITIPYVSVVLTIITYTLLGYMGALVGWRQGNNILSGGLLLRGRSIQTKLKGGSIMPKILDTSVIIDGRILDIMKTGFIEGQIVIPDFVLVELRHVSDSSDSLKRNRGRRGLDVLKKIQSEYGVEIYDTAGDKSLEEIPEVDVKLLKLAQRMDGKVVTNDYNLNKVAGIQGVEVLNINELANSLKPVVLPGERMSLFLVKEGKNKNQALAYLDDGTMIVVEDAREFIGKNIDVHVSSVLQTAAGRMIFARPVGV